ncbi:hypothetical protein [Streptomyces sp. NPDC059874]|uniref:hypothetical protein n=1 Tax=Streptomyces sp. NPDC059874 TaxID=3346983 RepID=UPI003650D042
MTRPQPHQEPQPHPQPPHTPQQSVAAVPLPGLGPESGKSGRADGGTPTPAGRW